MAAYLVVFTGFYCTFASGFSFAILRTILPVFNRGSRRNAHNQGLRLNAD
jgi:hypothetical protein